MLQLYVLTQWMWFSRVFLCKSLIGVTSSKRLPDTPSDVHNELFNHVKEEEEKRAKKILDTIVPLFWHAKSYTHSTYVSIYKQLNFFIFDNTYFIKVDLF